MKKILGVLTGLMLGLVLGLGTWINTAEGQAWRDNAKGSTLITTLGTITTGTWSATTIAADKGGTGVANNVAATLTRSGNHALTITTSGTANVNVAGGGTVTYTIASGAKALATGAISSAACTSAQTDTATGTATTDTIIVTFNADPTAVTGYVPLTTGMLTIIPYPTTNTVNFKVCNNTSSSITPGAITLNWRVVR